MKSEVTFQSFECLSVLIKLESETCVISSIYRPPQRSIAEFESDFSSLCENVLLHEKFIILGDFNMPSKPQSPLPLHLRHSLETFDLIDYITESTHKNGNILDRIISRRDLNIVEDIHYLDGVSDHMAINFNLVFPSKRSLFETWSGRLWRRIDLNVFCQRIALETRDVLLNIDSTPESSPICSIADMMVEHYNNSISIILDELVPQVTRRKIVNKSTPWWNNELRQMRRTVRRSEKQWRQTKLTVHREIYATTKKDYHRQLYESRSHYLNVTLDKNENNPRSHWKILNSCLGRVATNTLPAHVNSLELANQFNAFFIKKVADIANNLCTSPEPDIPTVFVQTPLAQFQPVCIFEVKDILLKSPRKSCPDDIIPLWILIESMKVLLPALVVMINRALKDGIPQSLKKSVVTPIYKKKNLDPNNMSSYRPVSNTPTLSKLIERVVLSRLESHLSVNNLFMMQEQSIKCVQAGGASRNCFPCQSMNRHCKKR
jgi:hypothetical protein